MSEFKLVDIEIERIDTHPACDVRQETLNLAVDIYANRLKDLPPVTLFAKSKINGDGTDHWLADGNHTYLANIKAGSRFVKARVKAGTYSDAFKYACHANLEMEKTLEKAGVPVYEGDKKHRVEMWLKRSEAKGMTQPEIAELCGVSHQYVARVMPNTTNSTSRNRRNPPSSTPTTPQPRKNDVFSRTKRPEIEAAIRATPEATNKTIADQCGVNSQTVARIRKDLGITNPNAKGAGRPRKPKDEPTPSQPTEPVTSEPLPGQMDLFDDEEEIPPIVTHRPMPFNAAKKFMALECAILDEFQRWPEGERTSFARMLLLLGDQLRKKTGLVLKGVSIVSKNQA